MNVTVLAHGCEDMAGGLRERDRIMREIARRFESELSAWHSAARPGAYTLDRVSFTYHPSVEVSLSLRGVRPRADDHAELFWRLDGAMRRQQVAFVPFKLIDWAIAPTVLVPSLRLGEPHRGVRSELLDHLERIKAARLRFILPLLDDPAAHAVRHPDRVLEFYTGLSPLEAAMAATVHGSTRSGLASVAPLWIEEVPKGIGLTDQELEAIAHGLIDRGWLSGVAPNGTASGRGARSVPGIGTPAFEAGRGPKLRQLPAREILGL